MKPIAYRIHLYMYTPINCIKVGCTGCKLQGRASLMHRLDIKTLFDTL